MSSALGHSSPMVTKQFYDRYLRRSFSANLRGGLGLGKGAPGPEPAGDVIPLRPKRLRSGKRS